MNSLEMSSTALPSTPLNLWSLYNGAVKAKYGDSIQLINTQQAKDRLNNLDFEISIVSADPCPVETRKAIIDFATKEFNNCCKEADESVIHVTKSNAKWIGSRYHFFTTRKGHYGIGGNIGPHVIHLAITGGSTTIGVRDSRVDNIITTREEQSFGFNYAHKEKIVVPPMTQVRAKVISHSVNYEQGYTILFSLPAHVWIPVTYRTSFQQMIASCCGGCFNTGSVNAAQIFRSLPEYRNENGIVSFVQRGILSWIGEGCTIEKEEEPLYQNDH